MAEDQSSGLWRVLRTKGIEKAVEIVLNWAVDGLKWLAFLALGGVALLARHWIVNEWTCIRKPWCEVSGWSLGLLMLGTVAVCIVAVWLAFRLLRGARALGLANAATAAAESNLETERAKPAAGARVYLASQAPFSRITVDDKRLDLRWIIRRPPKEWLDLRDIARNVTPAVVQQIIDGPFHAVPNCNAALAEYSSGGGGYSRPSPVFEELCPSCGKQVFRGREEPHGFGHYVDVWPVRAQALEEVQRLNRNGAVLDGTQVIELERPAYWREMLPP